MNFAFVIGHLNTLPETDYVSVNLTVYDDGAFYPVFECGPVLQVRAALDIPALRCRQVHECRIFRVTNYTLTSYVSKATL